MQAKIHFGFYVHARVIKRFPFRGTFAQLATLLIVVQRKIKSVLGCLRKEESAGLGGMGDKQSLKQSCTVSEQNSSIRNKSVFLNEREVLFFKHIKGNLVHIFLHISD